MTVSRIVTASALLSLSGIAFWHAIKGLPKLDEQESESEDAASPATDRATSAKQVGKRSIAKPEKLAQAAKTTAPATSPATSPAAGNPIPVQAVAQLTPNLPLYRVSAPEATRSLTTNDDEPLPVSKSLRDVEGHWAQYYIESLATRRIVQGFPDGSFRPDRPITQTEFNTLARKAFPNAAPVSYNDLRSLMSAQTVTRAEAVAYLYRVMAKTEAPPIVTSIRVSGAVSRPGAYSLAAMSNEYLTQTDRLPTVSRAIQQAGGSLLSANLQQVEIHRITDAGATKVFKVNAGRSLQAQEIAPDAVLQQDDRVVIPAIVPTAQRSSEAPAVESGGDSETAIRLKDEE